MRQIHPNLAARWCASLSLRLVVALTAAGAMSSTLLSIATAEAATELPPSEVFINVDSPTLGEVVRNKVHLAPIRGSAQSGNGDPIDFDVIVAIDVSKSTRFPSGIDVDGDGEIGFNPADELVRPGEYPEDLVCTDPEDTILTAELQAARHLLEVLSAGRTQVGVIAFSGDVDLDTGKRKSFDQQDAWVVVPLTDDFDQVRAALDQIEKEGPHGATNFSAAVQLSVVELSGLTGARSKPRPGTRKVVLFLTDGEPSFPFGLSRVSDPEDIEAAINASRLARKAGVTVNTFALGRNALASPVAVTEMARLTSGTYTPVRNPGDIVAFLQGISFANIDDVVITNLTTREISYDIQLAPDGSFTGFVPVREGANKLQITALAADGGESSIEFDLDFETSGLTERELAVELDRIKKRNKEMLLLLERKRIEAFRKRQQKRVTIEADD